MTIVVWTPTVRPGLDVAHESVRRQTLADQIYWILGDDFDRPYWAYEKCNGDLDYIFHPRKLTGATFSADAGHNEALRIARALDADLFVFMMDYTAVPPDGVQRFARMADRYPDALLTGIASRTSDPDAGLIVDPGGPYTIFAEPYTVMPQNVDWIDGRMDRATDTIRELAIEPIRWEANWAALPKRVLMDERLNFDEAYDEFHGHDNIDFAFRAGAMGYECRIDFDNQVLRLPRRSYWPHSEKALEDAQEPGRLFFETRAERPWLKRVTSPDEPGCGLFWQIMAEDVLDALSHGDRVRAMKHWREHLCPLGELHVRVAKRAVSEAELKLAFIDAGFRRTQAISQDDAVMIVRGQNRAYEG